SSMSHCRPNPPASLASYIILHPPSSTLFPYTTLFRSINGERFEAFRGDRLPTEQLDEWMQRAWCGEQAPEAAELRNETAPRRDRDRKSTRLNSSHGSISYAVFCLKKKKNEEQTFDHAQ